MAGTIGLTVPAGADGDLLLALVAAGHANNFSGNSAITPDQSGWTATPNGIASIDLGAGTGIRFASFYRIAAASDPGSFSFSWVDPINSAFGGHMYRAGRVDQADPIQDDDTPVVQAAADPLVIAAPSLTALPQLPRLVVMHLANSQGNGPWTTPAGMTDRGEGLTVGALVPLAIQVADEAIAAAGATGTRSASYDNGGGSPIQGIAYSLLINPFCGV